MEYKLINGVKCYALEHAYENDGISAQGIESIYKTEKTNFWFVSRFKVIRELFQSFLGSDSKTVLEIGCGTGYILHGLQKAFPSYHLIGSEIHLKGIAYARALLPDAEFVQLDARRMPFQNQFDAVGAFDVLEHIEEDSLVMKNVHQSLKEKGYFFVTVPQYMCMWSEADEILLHKRRYERTEITQKLESAGFKICFVTCFLFTLFPLMFLARKLPRKNITHAENPSKGLELPTVINKIFTWVMKLDEFLIRKRIKLPYGGSIVIVAQKK